MSETDKYKRLPYETLHSARKRVEEAEQRRSEAKTKVGKYLAAVRIARAENKLMAIATRELPEDKTDLSSSVHY